MVEYLTAEDTLLLHHLAVEETGGSHGLRDLGLLESAIGRPKATLAGKDLYPTIFEKAAVLCHSLIKNHPFVDGNKRTSLLSAMTFLERNGHKFVCSQVEVVEFGVKIDTENISIEKITQWFKKNSRKIKK